MKTYKWLRGVLKASAFTTMMFVMQACYGTPTLPPEREDETEMSENDSIQTPETALDESTNEEIASDNL